MNSSITAAYNKIKQERADVINRVMDEWSDGFVAALEAQAKSRLRDDTGQGTSSFDHTEIKAGLDRAAQIQVSFYEYLRYFDMRNSNLRRDRDLSPEGIETIKEWVDRNYNELIGGYAGKTVSPKTGYPIPRTRIINNMAWGISKKRTRIKRKQWYNKLKSQKQYQLYFTMLDELLPVMLEQTKRAII